MNLFNCGGMSFVHCFFNVRREQRYIVVSKSAKWQFGNGITTLVLLTSTGEDHVWKLHPSVEVVHY